MYRVLGFSFDSVKGGILFIVALVVFVFMYHKLLQSSVRNAPESTHRAVREHCRYILGKQFKQMEKDAFVDQFQSCDNFRVKSVNVAGGVLDPVIVKISLETQPGLPLGKDIFIFKTSLVNFNFFSGLSCLMSGKWEFNFYNTYSDFTFNGSI